MSFNPEKPYNELPKLPPETEIKTKKVLEKALTTSRVLGELKGIADILPNSEILITPITLHEAKSSSEIENVVTTNDELYKSFTAELESDDPATKEVLRYREALWEGYKKLTETGLLTTNLFVEIFQNIMQRSEDIRNTPGTKLTDNEGNVIYTPPEGENVIRDMLRNLEEYIHEEEDSVDPLIKTAVIHYQFEAIHPFTDGNGRTGRIILILYLIFKKLLDTPIVYLSRYIIEKKADYYKLLRNVTEKGEWEEWIIYILNGIEETSKISINLAEQIQKSLEHTLKKVKTEKKSPIPKEVIEIIYKQPYCKIGFIIKENIAQRKAAERYLKELERLGILKSEKIGKEVIYLNTVLYDILKKT